jgi:TRAP-type transport system periplasmic protein
MSMNRKRTARFIASFFLAAAFLVPAVFPGVVQAQKIELSIAHQAPPTFVYQIISEKFKEMLESKTGDKVKVNIFHSGQLGQEKEYIEGQMMGTADIALVTSGLLTLWEPLMVYIDLPYLYRDVEHANKVANGPIGEEINKKLEKHGIMVLVCGDMGFQSLYNRKKPVNKPDDFAGMKIRVIQNPMQIDLMNAWGAQAVPMNFGEVYSALQQGVIDAAANEPYTYDIVKHFEVAPYYSITNHLHKMYAMTMSKKRFDSLPKDVQQAILETAKALLPVSTKITTEIDLKIIGKLIRENRVLFNTADIDAFRKLSQGVLDKWSEKVGKETVDKIKAVK